METKKLDNIYRKGIRIYSGAFRTTVESYDPFLELRNNELGLIFLYKLRSSTTYTEFLNTLDDRTKTIKKTGEKLCKGPNVQKMRHLKTTC